MNTDRLRPTSDFDRLASAWLTEGPEELADRVLDAAHLLGINTVSTFVGRDETRKQSQNLQEMARVFAPLLDYAGVRSIRTSFNVT